MAYAYRLLAEAQDEYEKAIEWYLERSIDAATGFIASIDRTLELICATPQRWRHTGRYYELGARKYPYSVIYLIDEARLLVIVISIYHHRRNPQNKYG